MDTKKAFEGLKTNRIKVFGLSTGITLAFVFVFGSLGYVVDMYLGTKPIGTIVGLVISFPLNQIYLIKKVKNIK